MPKYLTLSGEHPAVASRATDELLTNQRLFVEDTPGRGATCGVAG
ncbi:MAG: hypothetical protein ACT4NY_07540 [Pseudonocardiales bacterium]